MKRTQFLVAIISGAKLYRIELARKNTFEVHHKNNITYHETSLDAKRFIRETITPDYIKEFKAIFSFPLIEFKTMLNIPRIKTPTGL